MNNTIFQVKEDSRSLNKPSWFSSSLSPVVIEEQDYELEGEFCFIRTSRAIYYRVLIVKETRSILFVKFTVYDKKVKSYISTSETIQKRDILNIRKYEN